MGSPTCPYTLHITNKTNLVPRSCRKKYSTNEIYTVFGKSFMDHIKSVHLAEVFKDEYNKNI